MGGTTAQEWVPLEDTPTDVFWKSMQLNFAYTFFLCRDLAKNWIDSGRGGACSRLTLSVMFPKPNSQGNSDGHIDGNRHVPDFPRCWNPDSSLNRCKDGLWQWNGKEYSRAQR